MEDAVLRALQAERMIWKRPVSGQVPWREPPCPMWQVRWSTGPVSHWNQVPGTNKDGTELAPGGECPGRVAVLAQTQWPGMESTMEPAPHTTSTPRAGLGGGGETHREEATDRVGQTCDGLR